MFFQIARDFKCTGNKSLVLRLPNVWCMLMTPSAPGFHCYLFAWFAPLYKPAGTPSEMVMERGYILVPHGRVGIPEENLGEAIGKGLTSVTGSTLACWRCQNLGRASKTAAARKWSCPKPMWQVVSQVAEPGKWSCLSPLDSEYHEWIPDIAHTASFIRFDICFCFDLIVPGSSRLKKEVNLSFVFQAPTAVMLFKKENFKF